MSEWIGTVHGGKGLGLFQPKANENHTDFMNVLERAVEETNRLQIESDDYAEKLAAGEVDNIHEVMIATQKADISLQLLSAVRGNVIDAYNEIMRMQI